MEKGDPEGDLHATCRQSLEALRTENAALRKRLEELEARLNRNSRNSSKPPSSNPPWIRNTPPKAPGERAPGGQPGHPGRARPLLPPDQISQIVTLKPDRCRRCGREVRGEDPAPLRQQVTEIPSWAAQTTEYRRHRLRCGGCGETTCAELPAGVGAGCLGPRAQALLGLLTGQFHLSKRLIQELIRDVVGIQISLGSIVAAQQAVSEAVAGPVEEARAYVREQTVVHADETSWKEGRKKAWLWAAATRWVSVFLIHASRGAQAAGELLGEFMGYLVTDRWNGYCEWPISRRQICWAHLIRDFRAFSEWKGAEAIGKALLEESRKLFELWHRVRDGTLLRSSFPPEVGPIRLRVEELLRSATRSENRELARSAGRMLKVYPAFWTFVEVEGVEPTNNAAERALRPAVLYRKISFGTQSPEGSRFVERIMTVVTSLRQQGRNVLGYLTEACQRANQGKEAPSLVPQADQLLRITA